MYARACKRVYEWNVPSRKQVCEFMACGTWPRVEIASCSMDSLRLALSARFYERCLLSSWIKNEAKTRLPSQLANIYDFFLEFPVPWTHRCWCVKMSASFRLCFFLFQLLGRKSLIHSAFFRQSDIRKKSRFPWGLRDQKFSIASA